MFALPIFPGRPSVVVPSASVRWTLAGTKKRARISPDSQVFALPIFPGSRPPSIVGVHELNFCVRDGREPERRRRRCKRRRSVCCGRRGTKVPAAEDIRRAPQTETGGTCSHLSLYIEKSPGWIAEAFVFALPIFPGSRPPSIVGVHELNFCVRDGNRWTLMTINTNYSGDVP